jgi:L-aminopeptidase/D-esterase-like protein
MEITINGKVSADPRDRVLAIEAVAQAICESVGLDVAEGTMMLLTAAVHIAMKHSERPIKDVAPMMAECLGCAIVAADDFFTLRTV